MNNGSSFSSSSDTDELDSCVWSLKNRKHLKQKRIEKEKPSNELIDNYNISLSDKYQKFEELKQKSDDIRRISSKKLYYLEKKRSKKLIKKALRDPFIKELVDQNTDSLNKHEESCVKKEAKEWKEVKPYLNVNSHIQGPISQGDWGPKTELENTIDNAIKEGDIEKAELLSDTLANREFAVKIAKAYSAKRYNEELEKQKSLIKDKNSKKIRWTFEAKERWQMKGNM